MKKRDVLIYVVALIFVIVSGLNIIGTNKAVLIPFNIALLVVGFVLLIKGADIFVESASKVAVKFNIPQMIIGLTIVAFGTSAPEAAISISAAFSGEAGITIGNIVGSNIMNILLILGISACIAPLIIKKDTLKYEIPFMLIITVLLLLFGMRDGKLTIIDGASFISLLVVFIIYLVFSAKKGKADEETELSPNDTIPKLILLIIFGMGCIIVGSDVTVDAASYVATEIGMSPRLIGLTIVAFGTSLPELITSATAAKRGKVDIAIGNIVGSNIFNILFVVGTVALITPVTFDPGFIKDTLVAIGAVILLFLCVIKDKKLKKSGGIVMLLSYAVYFGYIIIMNYR